MYAVCVSNMEYGGAHTKHSYLYNHEWISWKAQEHIIKMRKYLNKLYACTFLRGIVAY